MLSRARINLGLAAAVLLGAPMLGGCSVMGVLAATTPAHGARIVQDIPYAEGPRHRLDVYEPPHGAEPLPVVVFFYGGSWQAGERRAYAFVGRALASKGLVAVVPDYRIYPDARYPDFLRDSAAAVRWTRDHAAEYGGDPRRIFLMGHSAGAYNAVMLALDRRWLGEVGMSPQTDIRGALGLAGPYDFLPITDRKLKVIFGPRASWPSTQPVAHADAKDPPLWLATGADDIVVDPDNTMRLAERVRQVGGRVEAKVYPSMTHRLLLGVFAGPFRFMAPVLKDAVGFIHAHDRPG